MRTIKIYIEIYWLSLLYWFGVKPSSDGIPEGPYCYVPDFEKNSNKDKDDHYYYIKTCKYYRGLRGYKAGCAYMGFVGNDLLLWDKCKICGENDKDDEYED